jgi:hypothetical protein
MIRTLIPGAILALTLFAGAPAAAATDRLTDHDVKQLLDKIDQQESKFVDALPDDFKKKVIRETNTEVVVKRYLEDFDKRIETVKNRFSSDSSASVEVADLLRQATGIDSVIAPQATSAGASEWTRLRESLTLLADAYGAKFPLPRDAAMVRRMNDKEVATVAKEVSANSDQVKKAVDAAIKKDKSLNDAQRQEVSREMDVLAKAAKTLASRLSDNQPSSAEARALINQAERVGSMLEARHLTAAAGPLWTAINSQMRVLTQAYRLTT